MRKPGFRHSAETKEKMRNAASRTPAGHRCAEDCGCGRHSGWQRGRVPSAEQLRRQSEAGLRRYARNPIPHLEALAKGRATKGPTRLERALGRLLDGAGLEFERERRFGVYHVDAYVPSHNLVFEADGEWGHSPARDAARDRYLVRGGVVAVIRLVRDDLAPFMERT